MAQARRGIGCGRCGLAGYFQRTATIRPLLARRSILAAPLTKFAGRRQLAGATAVTRPCRDRPPSQQIDWRPARMKTKVLVALSFALTSVLGTHATPCLADNPIIQTKYTADPAPMVYNGTVYLYTSHGEDDAVNFTMYNWMLYTTTDMANW